VPEVKDDGVADHAGAQTTVQASRVVIEGVRLTV